MGIEGQKRKAKIAIFVSFSGQGGVERMMVNLSEGLTRLGCVVDLLVIKKRSPHLRSLSPEVNVIQLSSSHTIGNLPDLISYLRRERPDALLASKDRANQIAIIAGRLARVPLRVVVRMGTTVSSSLEGKSRWTKRAWYLPIRYLYPMADDIIAISQGVASDLSKITGLPLTRFQVIHNPVVTADLHDLAKEPVGHPWFAPGEPPVILGAGRLTRQKDFPTLLKAFAILRRKVPCRLVILGEGGDRTGLQHLAGRLNIGGDFSLPGFVANPFAYMSRASLFVLSSVWEGFGNALAEAMAVGVPVVSTDCPSGPHEILDGGRYGPLVSMGDHKALAEAMLSTLTHPPSQDFLKTRAEAFSVDESSRRYLRTLLDNRSPEESLH
jgi:glycosyltransferase involved in cell wall biosynthesis